MESWSRSGENALPWSEPTPAADYWPIGILHFGPTLRSPSNGLSHGQNRVQKKNSWKRKKYFFVKNDTKMIENNLKSNDSFLFKNKHFIFSNSAVSGHEWKVRGNSRKTERIQGRYKNRWVFDKNALNMVFSLNVTIQ